MNQYILMKHDETPKPTTINHYKDRGFLINNKVFMESKAVFCLTHMDFGFYSSGVAARASSFATWFACEFSLPLVTLRD